MNKKLISLITAAALIVLSVFSVVFAFADDVSWNYDSNTNTLYIFGSGNMDDYSSPFMTPWSNYLPTVENLVVEEGVTSVGNNALSGASLLNSVTLADTVTSIGTSSFASCSSLMELTFSTNVISIGDKSFSVDGMNDKTGFVLNTYPGSYALYFAIKNGIGFNCSSVDSGVLEVNIPANTGMRAYFPFTPKLNGTFAFYSVSKDDPIGYFYDSNLNKLFENDDYSVKYDDDMISCDFSITRDVQAGETYYFATDIFNPKLAANYKVYLLGKDYNVHGNIYLMDNPEGDLTNIKMTDCNLNGQPTNGEYSIHVTSINYTVTLECDGVYWEHTFDTNSGENCDIGFMACDLNRDRVVNAKDYAMMQKRNYRFKYQFEDFMNFKY